MAPGSRGVSLALCGAIIAFSLAILAPAPAFGRELLGSCDASSVPAGSCRIFTDVGCKGKMIDLTPASLGPFSAPEVIERRLTELDVNDQISSAVCAPGVLLRLYRHFNLNGDSIILADETHDLRSHYFNDEASSLRMFRKRGSEYEDLDKSEFPYEGLISDEAVCSNLRELCCNTFCDDWACIPVNIFGCIQCAAECNGKDALKQRCCNDNGTKKEF